MIFPKLKGIQLTQLWKSFRKALDCPQTPPMVKQAFSINQRYIIDPSSGLFRDEETGKLTKVEPRIVEVLCLLASRPGLTISREEMVSVIWKDYGGGDEGLTQAVSALRKLLQDPDRSLIQTIPKKGYCLKADVGFDPQQPMPVTQRELPQSFFKQKKRLALLTIPVIACVVLLFNPFSSKDKEVQLPKQPSVVSFPGINPEANNTGENDKNTIVTVAPDSTVYKLVMIGDEPPRFYINGKPLPVHEWEPYQQLINRLKEELRKRTI
jgi:DNA-binding winged helix-turn-helix (wHTH) protein